MQESGSRRARAFPVLRCEQALVCQITSGCVRKLPGNITHVPQSGDTRARATLRGIMGPARRRTAVRGTGKFPAGGEGSGILLGPSSNRGPVLEFWQSRRQTPHTQRATTCSPKPLDDGSCPGADPRGFGNAGTFRARTQVDLLITSCVSNSPHLRNPHSPKPPYLSSLHRIAN